MNQPIADELISAYFDGEVTPAEREQVERLLETSIEFRQQLEDASKLSALLHSIPSLSAPAQLAENVERQLSNATVVAPLLAGSKRQSLRREWTAFGAGIMATMASLFLYVALNRSSSFPEHQAVARSKTGGAMLPQHPQALSKLDNQVAGTTVELGLSTASAKPVHLMTEEQTQSGTDASRSIPQMVATRALEDEKLREVGASLQIPNTMEPAQNDDFLHSLKNGDVVFRQVADPTNTVAVVEFTVIDTRKGLEGIEVLLKKRSVNTVTDDATKAPDEAKEALSRRDREPVAKSDDYPIIYVRAPGAELAETILEALKNHPDLYRGFAARLPIELPVNSSAIANRDAPAVDANQPTTALGTAATNDQQAVEDEGNLVVNSYANQIGLGVAVSAKREPSARAMAPAAAMSSKDARSDKGSADSVANLDRARKSGESRQKVEKSAAQALKEMPPNRNQEISNASQGYATFRVGLDSQRQSAQQAIGPNSNVTLQSKSNQVTNNALPFNYQNSNFPGGQFGAKLARSNSDNRDPRLVRMLIVLKPEQRATAP